MLGVLEAVHCGVPMVVTPLYRDQFINAAAVEEREIGVILPYENLNTEQTFEALQRAISLE
jgi:glucuronosyltransferase